MNPIKDDQRRAPKPARQQPTHKEQPEWLARVKPSRQRRRKTKDKQYD